MNWAETTPELGKENIPKWHSRRVVRHMLFCKELILGRLKEDEDVKTTTIVFWSFGRFGELDKIHSRGFEPRSDFIVVYTRRICNKFCREPCSQSHVQALSSFLE